jgi:hypothetical protein
MRTGVPDLFGDKRNIIKQAQESASASASQGLKKRQWLQMQGDKMQDWMGMGTMVGATVAAAGFGGRMVV